MKYVSPLDMVVLSAQNIMFPFLHLVISYLLIQNFNFKHHLYKIENIFRLNACCESGSKLKKKFISFNNHNRFI